MSFLLGTSASLSLTQDLVLVLIVIIAAALTYFVLSKLMPDFFRRRMAARHGEGAQAEDRAYNAVHAALALQTFLSSESISVPQATVLLERAELKMKSRNFPEALSLAQEATDLMAQKRRAARAPTEPVQYREPASGGSSGPEAPGPRVYRDLSHRAGEADPDTVPPPPPAGAGGTPPPTEEPMQTEPEEGEEPPLKAAQRKLPKNFMEARFMLNSLRNDLENAPQEKRASPEGKEAQEWAQKSQTAFDRKDYDESLRLAVRGRRRFGGVGMSTISVNPGTVIEAPPSEPSATSQRSSAPLGASPGVPTENLVCSRCGRGNNPGDRFCRGCGAPMTQPKCPRCGRPTEPEDKFCHNCGAPTGSTS